MADANIIVKIIDQTSGGINNITRQVNNVERSVKNTNTAFGGLNKALGAFVGFLGARELLRFANDVQTINNQIRLVTSSQQELNTTFDKLLTLANNTRSEFGAVTELYSKLSLATQDLGLKQETLLTVTKSFNQLLAIAGAETQAAEGATRQFAQALASGAFRGDEFNSVVEAAPGILDVLAQELGVTRGEVRALAGDGQITAEVLVRALTASAETIDTQFKQTNVTIGQALTVLQNNFLALGNEASPVLDGIAEVILLIANNLEVAIGVAAAFAAGFVFTAAINALAGLRAAIVAVNLAIAANPIGLVATAISVAIVGLYVYWDDLKDIAVGALDAIAESFRSFQQFFVEGFEKIKVAGLSIWTGIQTTYLEFENALLRGIEGLINNVVAGFTQFANSVTAQFKAVAAAARDPLNAFEAYQTALAEAKLQLEENAAGVVDFSGRIKENETRINSLNQELENEIRFLEESADQVENNTDRMQTYDDAILRVARQTEDTSKATDDLTGSTEELSTATGESITVQERREQALRDAERALQDANKAVDESIRAIENETDAISLSSKERDVLAAIIENENKIRKALGDTVEELSQEEIRLIQRAVRENETATLEFMRLSDDRIRAIEEVIDAKEREEESQRRLEDFTVDSLRVIEDAQRETMTEVERLVQEKEDFIREAEAIGLQDHKNTMDAILAYDQLIRAEQVKEAEAATREQRRLEEAAARDRERFIESNERLIRNHYRSTLDEVGRLEADRAELIRKANEAGLASHESTQRAILAIDEQIGQARIDAEQRVLEERGRIMDEQVSKYSSIYNDMESKLLEFVGINQSEFRKINEYAELFLGVNLRDIIRGVFTDGTLAIEGFRKTGELNLGGFGTFIGNIFGRDGNIFKSIMNTFDGSIFENFVNIGSSLLGGLGNTVGNIFSGLENAIGNIFGGSSSGGSGISRAVNTIGNVISTVDALQNRSGISPPSSTSSAYDYYASRNTGSGINNVVSTVNTISSVLSGGGNIISNAISGIKDFFGFDAGGYIPGGSMGIVGEFGPELVSGPANIAGRQQTAGMGGDVNINFTVNTIDAKDFDRLLVEKRDVIKNVVQSAVNQRARRI